MIAIGALVGLIFGTVVLELRVDSDPKFDPFGGSALTRLLASDLDLFEILVLWFKYAGTGAVIGMLFAAIGGFEWLI